MKNLLIKLFFFSTPIVLCSLFIFLMDGSNFFIVSSLINKNTKPQIINRLYKESMVKNRFWNLYQYQQNPCSNIIISDSKGKFLNIDLISELSGNRYSKLYVQGCNADTKFSIFWFAVAQKKLNHVVIQLDFSNWNLSKKNLFVFEQDYIKKPFIYLFTKSIYKYLYYTIKHKSNISDKGIEVSRIKFPLTDEKNKLVYSFLKERYRNYSYPIQYAEELKKIVYYCQANKILLEFIIFPTHQICYDYLSQLNIIRYNDQFIKEVSSLGKTHNYSSDRELNRKEEYFIDYFHQNQLITDSITRLVWGKN